ncbi:unnamed protein product [Paramecium sonneborni]|uniref:Transmembrane protein n=1 Tax=Paramecium sonneborni TaxID=65129 RepID=A0A8S1PK79_9CILI|nr:unnamed protein product [Paramecium sonneborni]
MSAVNTIGFNAPRMVSLFHGQYQQSQLISQYYTIYRIYKIYIVFILKLVFIFLNIMNVSQFQQIKRIIQQIFKNWIKYKYQKKLRYIMMKYLKIELEKIIDIEMEKPFRISNGKSLEIMYQQSQGINVISLQLCLYSNIIEKEILIFDPDGMKIISNLPQRSCCQGAHIYILLIKVNR